MTALEIEPFMRSVPFWGLGFLTLRADAPDVNRYLGTGKADVRDRLGPIFQVQVRRACIPVNFVQLAIEHGLGYGFV